ncbi:MAG TPA: alkaline phosphatase family protein [Gallionella sp.]|nr:alkaline phosphatase family protein [Gallionella sp.]
MLRLLVLLLTWHIAPAVAQPLPRPDHIVIVVEENKSFAQIIGNPAAPYINALAVRGALFTQSYGVTHPSQPNYLALFTGTTRGISSNACPLELSGANLAGALLEKGLSFTSYAESMPQAGFDGCVYGAYMRKHNPVANWKELAALNQPFSVFPQDFEKLPTVALVVPDQRNDMHDGSIAQGDAWLAKNIEPYAQWAMTHNSLLIVTWDEDDGSADNRVATLFVGPMVRRGNSAQRINHYNILRTLSEMYGLPYLGESTQAAPIGGAWRESGHAKNSRLVPIPDRNTSNLTRSW